MMARRNAEDEKLDDANIQKVIALLEAEKPITKKDACAMLNISYNTTRLDKLIEGYKTKKALDAKRRAEKRGKPATLEEAQYIITEYLEGKPIDAISKGTYRGTTFVKNILEKYGVPERLSSPDYFHPSLIPEQAMRESFLVGEHVYSARYDSMAVIKAEIPHKEGKVYRIWLEDERWQQYAYQPIWELASLQHIRDAGIVI